MKRIREHVYHFKNMVIGATLESLAYAYLKNYPIIYTELKYPFKFSYFSKDENLEYFGIENKINYVQTIDKVLEFGTRKEELFKHFLFIATMVGLSPLADKVSSIMIEDKNLSVITKNNSCIKIDAENIIIFDDFKISGLPHPKEEGDKIFKVLDWINVRSGTKHKLDLIMTDDKFVNEIHFFPSERIDGKQHLKDALAVSHLTEEQLLNIDYSDTYVKFKVLDLMKNAGIKGRSNGWSLNNPKRKIYRAIKIEPAEREVFLLQKNKYENYNNIQFLDLNFKEIVDMEENINIYSKRLSKLLFKEK